MRNNKNGRNIMNQLDISYESYKHKYQKISSKKNTSNNTSQYLFTMNKKNNNDFDYTTYQSINRNKSNISKKGNINEQTNILNNNKLNLLHIQNKPNRISKKKFFKYQKASGVRDCHTPDKKLNNLNNIGLSANKKENSHNISLLKSNIQKNSSFIEQNFKNKSKKILKRSKSKINILSIDRKKAITPDRPNKSRNIKFGKNQINFNKYKYNKKIKEPRNKFNFGQNNLILNFNKSHNNNNISNNFNNSRSTDYNDILNNSSFNNNMQREIIKKNNPDKLFKNIYYNNSKLYSKKIGMSTKLSNDKFSNSFSSQNYSNERKNQIFMDKNNSYLFSNLKLNQVQKNSIYNKNNYYSKIFRSKSTDVNNNKKYYSNDKHLFSNNNNYSKLKPNPKNKSINNVSYEKHIKNYPKIYKIGNNNDIIYNQLTNTNSYYNLSQNSGNSNLIQINKYKKNIKGNEIINNKNINSKTFLEKAQQIISNNKLLNQKNNKYAGVNNNFITKSSTNTNDDINSSHSIISRNNQIMDSIEEIHFNFVNVVQSSRNLVKIQENIEGERIITNNPNSTVIIVEERDIE